MLNFGGVFLFLGQQQSSCSCQMGKPYIFSRGQRSLLRRLRLRSSLRSQASHLERLGKRNTKHCDVVVSSCKIYMFIFIHRYIYWWCIYIWGLIWCMCDFFNVMIFFICTACASHTIYIHTEILFLNRSTLHIFAQHSNMFIYQACSTSWRRYPSLYTTFVPLTVYISVCNHQKPYWLWALEIGCGS